MKIDERIYYMKKLLRVIDKFIIGPRFHQVEEEEELTKMQNNRVTDSSRDPVSEVIFFNM